MRQRKAQHVKLFYHKETSRGNGDIEAAKGEEKIEATAGNRNAEVTTHVE